MSEATKPVEEPVTAPTTTEAPAASEPVVPETTPAETAAPVTETPAAAAVEPETATPAKEEIKPVEEGVLGYKGPGLLKSLIFQKKFFWFGIEPVETKDLASYLRGEKETTAANHNAAWASHTGKGLLFFSKKSTDKASPAGVFNLSEVSKVAKEGTVDFHFTTGSHKHTFQAATLAERDNWVSVLETKVEEAKAMAEEVKGSETYKKSHSSLSKPALVGAVAAKKEEAKEEKKEEKAEKKEEKTEAKEEKKEEKAEKKEEKKEVKEEKKEEKKERKSRSASRKRTSIFGSMGFGKKEEKKEEKAAEETPAAPAAAEETPAPVEAAPVATEPVAAETPAEAPATTEEATATKPAPTKRSSIFGNIKQSFTKEKKPEAEAAPAVPAKDSEPVAETAPVIPAVESTEPLATSVASPATVPTETTAVPATNGETKTETPVAKSDKRKSSLPWLSKKEKPTSDEEGEKPKSPFAKLRATVKGKSSPKAEKAPEAKAEEPEATPAATEATPETKAEEPVVSEPVPAVQSTTPVVAASA